MPCVVCFSGWCVCVARFVQVRPRLMKWCFSVHCAASWRTILTSSTSSSRSTNQPLLSLTILLLVCLKTARDCRRPLETTGQLYIKHDAKFCAKLAAHGKENVAYIATSGVSSTRNSSRKPNYVLRVVKKANCMLTVTAGHCRLKIAYATAW